MNAMQQVPPDLADADLVALVLPFGEPVNPAHPDAPVRYEWGDVPLPRKPLPLLEEHDGRQIGLLSFFVKARSGLWARVKAGRTASALIARGFTGLSAEIDDGKLVGAAFVTDGEPAFRSARIVVRGSVAAARDTSDVRFGLDPRSGALAFYRPVPVQTPARVVGSGNLTDTRRFLDGVSMRPVQDEVRRARERFRERQEEIAQEAADREEAMLVAAGVPTSRWPEHLPGRQRYDAMVAHQRADKVAAEGVVAASEFAERMADLERKAQRRPRWWSR